MPVGYTPHVGPGISFHLSYDHREGRHPQTIDYGHVGPMWSHNWLSYVTEPGHVILHGRGRESHVNMPAQLLTRGELVEVTNDPPRYERTVPDGTVEVFTPGDRRASQPGRRIFLTEVIDPQVALEGRGFDSKEQCKFRIDFWVDKWKGNRGTTNRNYDRWQRFFGPGCRVQ